MDSPRRILKYKLVLLGDSAVGKSSVLERFVKDEFSDVQQPTIGATFLTNTLKMDDDYSVKFEIWDTAGQERYRSLAPMYYRGAGAALVVYDITDPVTFTGAQGWIEELQRQGSPDIIIGLAGNKSDLRDSQRVSTEEGKKFAIDNGLLYYETSAKTGENIRDIFVSIARKLPKNTSPASSVLDIPTNTKQQSTNLQSCKCT